MSKNKDKTPEEPIQEQQNQEGDRIFSSINTIIAFVDLARKRGVYSFDECREIANALDAFKS